MDEKELIIPDHIAIILDGNGRYATRHGLPRKLGHKAGCETLEEIVEESARLYIKYLTVYVFSTENWKRSAEEVGALMALLRVYIKKLTKKALKNNVRVNCIGDETRLDEDIREMLRESREKTAHCTGMVFTMALNYGSRDEIKRAVRSLASKAASGEIAPEDITEQTIAEELDTADMPDPDLLIRTAGEQRLSNYLLWQSAYTEFYYTDVLWPDFHRPELIKAIEAYNMRDRRYGGRK
ncbi:MAG: isoprenyl transferase [Lachnospiraceae bacterium]|nr:isoprenyl transferase [Lachnospiraceae bacterium]